jgi:hypothetical protein
MNKAVVIEPLPLMTTSVPGGISFFYSGLKITIGVFGAPRGLAYATIVTLSACSGATRRTLFAPLRAKTVC